MHPFTHVLLLSGGLPSGRAYTNGRTWGQRGWCFFEGCASALVKGELCLWDERAYEGAGDLDGLRRQCQAGRLPPMSPTDFEAVLRRGVNDCSLAFTAGKVDEDLIVKLYARDAAHAPKPHHAQFPH